MIEYTNNVAPERVTLAKAGGERGGEQIFDMQKIVRILGDFLL